LKREGQLHKVRKIPSILISVLLFAAFFTISVRDCHAQESSASGQARLNKEELKLDIKPLLPKNGERDIQLPEKEPAAKFLLNIKSERIGKARREFKKTFKPEVGLVEVVSHVGGQLTLKDCIDISVKNHLPLQIAAKNIKLAEMRVFEARRNMLPTATIDYQEYTGRVGGRMYTGRKQYVEGQQPIFHGGELFFTMKQAEVNLEVARKDYDRIKNELILQVKKGYYTLAKAKENLKMQQVLSSEVGAISDMVKQQYDAGIAAKLEFLNVSSQSGQVQYQLASAEGDESVSELVLKQTMNIDPQQKIDIEPELEFKKISVDFEEALRAAYNNRAEIRINSLMVDYYKYGHNISKAKGWPKVDILGSWGLAKEEYLTQDFGTDGTGVDEKLEQQWYGGVKVSMPFWGSTAEYSWTREQWVPLISSWQGTEANTHEYKFKILDKLDYYSEKQLALIDFDKARQEFIKAKQDVTMEVKEGYFNYRKALIQLDTASNKVQYQEKDLEFMKLKRKMDEVPDSNVVESMIKLAQEKFGYVQALTDCHISLASVNKAIGVEDYFKDET